MRTRIWTLVLMSVAGFMIALDTTVVTTVLATIRRQFAASSATLGWVVTAYVLTFGALLLTGAALGDRYGRRRMFVVGLIVFTAASSVCGLAGDIGVLVAARAVQGAGAALVLPLAMTQLSTAFPPSSRGRALGVFTGVAGLATFSGPLIGGLLDQSIGWHAVFWVNVPIGIALVGLVLGVVPPTSGPRSRLDIPGVLLAVVASLGVVWGLVRVGAGGWPEVAGSLAAGLLAVAAFVGWERRAAAPMLPLRLFRVRSFTAANLANVGLIASMYGALFFLAQYLQTVLGYGPLGTGWRLMPWTGVLMVGGPIAGRLADRYGSAVLLTSGLVLHGAGLLGLAAAAHVGAGYGGMLVPLLVGGLGISLAIPAAQKAAVCAVPDADLGRASGVFNTLRQLGGVLGVAVAVLVFTATGGYATRAQISAGFAWAMIAAAVLAFGGALGNATGRAATHARGVAVRAATAGHAVGIEP
jgi:EmrB/QacA subfamily drug resistance transporter